MKHFFFTFFAMISVTIGLSQTICGTDYYLEQQILKDPSIQNVAEQNWILSDSKTGQSEGARDVQVIPVVFHIFHDGEEGNISYDQIISAMDMINEDFRRTNADTNSTRAIFSPYAADSEIEFRLATLDPDGNCTKGVVRQDIGSTSFDADDNVKSLSYWPSDQYFNIWVVNSINSSGVTGIILGYAQFPGTGSWNNYGVIVRNDRIGNIGTATSGDRTLTHEIGHCLNLLHTFQSGCGSSCDNTGDRVCDTPPVSSSTQTCDLNQNQCSNDANGSSVYSTDVVDQIENYMSYNECQNMFTLGQKDRMESAIASFPTLTSLVSGNNLLATGVLNTSPGICSAEFMASNQVICVGQEVSFTDLSFFNPIAHEWNFEGADNVISTQKNPIVTYSVPGVYPVTLTVVDSNSNTASTQEAGFITVLSSIGNTIPITEDFESENYLTDLQWYTDVNVDGFGWYLNTSYGYSGSNSIKAEAYDEIGIIEISSFSFDASNLSSGSLSFRHAYAPVTGESGNYLKVYVSSDCGESWKALIIYGTNTLSTRSDLNSAYNTPAASDWDLATATIPAEHLTSNLRVKFEYNVNQGNNLFIDDVNLNGTLSQEIQLRSPLNGDQNISSNGKLNWNATSTISYYHLEIDTDTSFNSGNYESHQINYLSSSSNNLDTEWDLNNLTHGQTYYWKVTGSLNGIDTALSEVWSFKVDSTTLGIGDVIQNPFKVTAYPNPATHQLNLRIASTSNEMVQIVMYDVIGNLVKTIFIGELVESETLFTFSRENLSNGVYLIQTISKNGMDTQRIILE